MTTTTKFHLIWLLIFMFLNGVFSPLISQNDSLSTTKEETLKKEDDNDDWSWKKEDKDKESDDDDDKEAEDWSWKKNDDNDNDNGRRRANNHYYQRTSFRIDADWDDDWEHVRIGLFDAGFSTYLYKGSLNYPVDLDQFDLQYGGSLHFNLHIIRHRIPLAKNSLWFEYGLSISWMNYKFSNDFKIVEDTIPFTVEDDGTRYKKNKLRTCFLEIPVMFTLVPAKKSNFNMSVGMYGGILLDSSQKLKTEGDEKTVISDDFNMNKFRYGVIGKIGFGPVALYVQYALTDLFKVNQGPELTPFNIGLTILNY